MNGVSCIYQVNTETDECKQVYVGTANPFYGAQVWKLSYNDSNTASSDNKGAITNEPENTHGGTQAVYKNVSNNTAPKTGDNTVNILFHIRLFHIRLYLLLKYCRI